MESKSNSVQIQTSSIQSHRFDAFISYKHGRSRAFSENLELALKAYAKPPWQRPMPIFRDEKYIVPGKPLDELIRDALRESRFLIYIASPEAAQSIWVQDELHYWCDDLNRKDDLLIILSDGTIAFDIASKMINWKQSDCLPQSLEPFLAKVPFFIDARKFDLPATQKLENAEFRRAINQIAAKLRGIDPIEMSGVEMRQYRRNIRVRNTLFTTILFSALGFAGATYLAVQNQRDAERQTEAAERRESLVLAAASRNASDGGRHVEALNLAMQGLPTSFTDPERPVVAETTGALIEAVNKNRLIQTVADEGQWSRVAAFGPNGNLFAFGNDAGDTVLWSPSQTPREVGRWTMESWVTSIAFAKVAPLLLTTSLDGEIKILTLDGGTLHSYDADLRINTAALSDNGMLMALATRDGTIQVRDVATGTVIAAYEGHTEAIEFITFVEQDTHILSASHDRTARLWNIDTKQDKWAPAYHQDWIISVDIAQEKDMFATASLDRSASIWRLSDGTRIAQLDHMDGVDSVKFNREKSHIITASRDRTAKVWRASDGALVATLPHSWNVTTGLLTKDGSLAITGTEDGSIRLWQVDSGLQIAVLGQHGERGSVATLTLNPSETVVASTSSNGEVRVWNLATESAAWRIGHTESAEGISFHPTDHILLSYSEDETCRIWDLTTATTRNTIVGGATAQSWCEWMPKGNGIVFSPFDGSLEFHLPGDTSPTTINAHEAPISHVAFAGSGDAIASAALDNTVVYWPDGIQGEDIQLGTMPDWVSELSFALSDRTLVAASFDGTVSIWSLDAPYQRTELNWPKEAIGRAKVAPMANAFSYRPTAVKPFCTLQ